MIVRAHDQTYRFAVCIPSRGRGARVTKSWTGKMAFLDAPGVFLGVDKEFDHEYRFELQKAHTVLHSNPRGSVSFARERVRRAATQHPGRFTTYVLTDDNARFTRESLDNLVRAQIAYQHAVGDFVIMAGSHSTARHFDRQRIENAQRVNGIRAYPRVSMMFWAIPGELYEQYEHPDDAYGYDDRHLVLWLIAKGVRHFMVTPDAPFAKARYQLGGQGRVEDRIQKNVKGTACLLRDFPTYMGLFDPAIPWATVLKYENEGLQVRLGGRNAR